MTTDARHRELERALRLDPADARARARLREFEARTGTCPPGLEEEAWALRACAVRPVPTTAQEWPARVEEGACQKPGRWTWAQCESCTNAGDNGPLVTKLAAAHKRWREPWTVQRVLRMIDGVERGGAPRAATWADVLTTLDEVQPARARVGLLHSLDLERVVVLARAKPLLGRVEQRSASLIHEGRWRARTFASGLRLHRCVALTVTRRVGGVQGSRFSTILVPDTIPLSWVPA